MSLHTRKIRSLLGATFMAGLMLGVAGTGVAATIRGSSIFADVTAGSFYDTAVGEMYNLGIIKGYDNGKFGPDDAVTRGQLAVMLQRFRNELTDGGTVISSSSRSSSTSSSSSSSSSNASHSPYGAFRLTAATYSGVESATIQILVVRTGGAQGTVNVDYATSNGTAIAGTDYTGKTGTLSFANNETSKTITLTATNNPLPQGNKTFNVTLSNVTNGGQLTTPNTAVVTILDNQTSSSSTSNGSSVSSSSSSNPAGTFNLSATAYMVNEHDGPITITVLRDGGSTGTATIAYGTTNGTATSGSNYTSVSGTLTFNAGETSKTFSIPVNYNSAITGNKAFSIVIGSPTGGASLGLATANVTISDNEATDAGSGSVKFTKSTYNVSKSAGYVDVAVQRTISAVGTVTVNYATTPLSAAAGVDYTAANGTVTFAPGESTKNIRVYIMKTSSSNSGNTFSVDLSGVSSNAILGSPLTTTVTIDN